jgi:hypothetical protein
MKQEPFLPVEKKLIATSLILGVVLLGFTLSPARVAKAF